MDVLHHSDGGGRRPSTLVAGAQPGGEFERALAHKLGNLLQVVNGNLELLALRLVDDRSRTYLANAQAATRELTDIAHSLVEQPNGKS